MKLEVWPWESDFGVDSQDNKGNVLEYRYASGYKLCASQYSRWVIKHMDELLIY